MKEITKESLFRLPGRWSTSIFRRSTLSGKLLQTTNCLSIITCDTNALPTVWGGTGFAKDVDTGRNIDQSPYNTTIEKKNTWKKFYESKELRVVFENAEPIL